MSKQLKSHLKRNTAFDYINSAVLLLIAVCCVYPFLYVFFVATTDGTYLARGEMTFLPMGFNLKAFGYILTNPRLPLRPKRNFRQRLNQENLKP